MAELIAGEVQHLQPAVVIGFIEPLQGLILRREAAARGGVDDQQKLAPQPGEGKILALAGLDSEIIDRHIVFLLAHRIRYN